MCCRCQRRNLITQAPPPKLSTLSVTFLFRLPGMYIIFSHVLPKCKAKNLTWKLPSIHVEAELLISRSHAIYLWKTVNFTEAVFFRESFSGFSRIPRFTNSICGPTRVPFPSRPLWGDIFRFQDKQRRDSVASGKEPLEGNVGDSYSFLFLPSLKT